MTIDGTIFEPILLTLGDLLPTVIGVLIAITALMWVVRLVRFVADSYYGKL